MMGADIHTAVQFRRRGSDDDWELAGVRTLYERSYEFFGYLAGVRGSSEPIYPVRGIPDDMEPYGMRLARDELGMKFEGRRWVPDDCHSFTWLTLSELIRCVDAARGHKWPDVIGTIGLMGALDASGYETRILISFDS